MEKFIARAAECVTDFLAALLAPFVVAYILWIVVTGKPFTFSAVPLRTA